MGDISSTRIPLSGAPCAFRGSRGYFYPGSGDVGVVLCPPWGLEEVAFRASWERLAAAIAQAGYPCLRFDYPGTGDSLGGTTDASDAPAWTRAAADATGFLRAYTGVSRFVVIGQSVGAAVALDLAAQRSDVTGVVLIHPMTAGSAYLRELQSLSGMDGTPGAIDLAGFSLGSTMAAGLQQIEPLKRGAGGLNGAVVFDRAGRKAGAEVSEHLRRLGVASEFRIIALGSEDDSTNIPSLPVDDIVGALASLHPLNKPAGPAKLPPLPATLRSALFREEPLAWLEGAGLLCRPAGSPDAEGTNSGHVLVLLDAGFSPDVGWRRMAVDLTRALAASGHCALRLDAHDLDEAALAPLLGQAIQALTARGFTRITIAATGPTAGAALRAARKLSLVEIIAIDPIGLVPGLEPRFAPSRFERLCKQIHGTARRHASGERIVFYQDLIDSLGGRRVPRVPALLRRARAVLQTALVNRIPHFIRINILNDNGLHEVHALLTSLAARGTKLSLVLSGEPHSLRELAYWGGATTQAPCQIALLPGDAQDPAAPEAASWLLDHFIETMNETAEREPVSGKRAAA